MSIDATPRSAYDHWNEERDIVWYQEVGRHAADQNEPDPDAWYEAWERDGPHGEAEDYDEVCDEPMCETCLEKR